MLQSALTVMLSMLLFSFVPESHADEAKWPSGSAMATAQITQEELKYFQEKLEKVHNALIANLKKHKDYWGTIDAINS